MVLQRRAVRQAPASVTHLGASFRPSLPLPSARVGVEGRGDEGGRRWLDRSGDLAGVACGGASPDARRGGVVVENPYVFANVVGARRIAPASVLGRHVGAVGPGGVVADQPSEAAAVLMASGRTRKSDVGPCYGGSGPAGKGSRGGGGSPAGLDLPGASGCSGTRRLRPWSGGRRPAGTCPCRPTWECRCRSRCPRGWR